MKLPHPALVMFLTSFLLLMGINLAQAPWEALSSGFAVTTNYHKIDVPTAGLPVTATAGWAPELIPENNPAKGIEVLTVEFVWHYPNGTVALRETVPVSGPIVTPEVPPAPIPPEISEWVLKCPDVTYWYAQNTQIPTVAGDWGVQAIFYGTVKICGEESDMVRTRSTSFFALSEVPFGTLALLLNMFGILVVFAIRKKHLLARSSRFDET